MYLFHYRRSTFHPGEVMSDGPTRNNLSPIDTNLNFTFNVYDDPWEPRALTSEPTVLTDPQQITPPVPKTIQSPVTQYKLNAPTEAVQKNTNNRRNESRKLLSIVLEKLADRVKPESIVDSLTTSAHEGTEKGFGAFAGSLRDAVKLTPRQENRSQKRAGARSDDSDDEKDTTFTTDETIELMTQLKDVLAMSVAQGWQIFDDGTDTQNLQNEGGRDSKISSAFRKSRRISKSPGKRGQSASPHRGQIRVPELLFSCVSILQSIVLEDCRYRVALPRPFRPPNTLQILTLNIAQFLIYSHRHNPRVISQIAFAMIPAFLTFQPQMFPRLLSFFEVNVIRTSLRHIQQVQGFSALATSQTTHEIRDTPENEDSLVVSIQIEEAEGESISPHVGHNRKWTTSTNHTNNEVQSTNNPRQPSTVYYLAFLIPPLLGVILDSLNTYGQVVEDVEMTSRFITLLSLMASSKVDVYNDLLEIVAYRDSKSRRMAISCLARLWPNSIGHAIISNPLCSFDKVPNSYGHQFMPWNFVTPGGRVRLGGLLHDDCRSCLKPIVGFALLCPMCMTAVHFDCYDYPEGNHEIQYYMVNDPRVQRIAMTRSSDLHFNADFPQVINLYGHQFTPKNWFTLNLCFACQLPLWGFFAQGFKCKGCNTSLHQKCIRQLYPSSLCSSKLPTSKDVVIDWASFRSSCLKHYEVLRYTPDQLSACGYEEIAIFYGVLKTQSQILNNGLEFGSIVIIDDNGRDASANLESFELHRVIQHCEALLASGTLPLSEVTRQYIQDTTARFPTMFDWSYLEFVTATIKSAFPQTRPGNRTVSNLLNVEHPADITDEEADSMTYPFECTTLAHMRNILAVDFAIQSDHAAQMILDHLLTLSFFDRVDHNALPFEDIFLEKDVKCIFPLPLGLDLSMNVETLVSSIEASLGDLDLSTNEFGFLLLTRKFWPNGLASEYGLRRLASRVLLWILDEDDNLAIILREFVAKNIPLPGVRYDPYAQSWPLSSDSRPGSAGLASNGGDYVAARRSLLSRFALPWLFELHNIRPAFYCQTIFDTCSQAVSDRDLEDSDMLLDDNKQRNLSRTCDNLLRSLIKLIQYSVVFSVFDDLFIRWMNFALTSGQANKSMPSLSRLWGHENDPSQRSTISLDPLSDQHESLNADPSRIILYHASQSSSGLSQSLAFLTSAVKSGVTLSTPSFKQFLTLIKLDKVRRFENADLFLRALVLSLWQKSFGRQDLQALVASLHSHLAPKILESLLSRSDDSISLSIIQQSLTACLRLYGCERQSIISAGLLAPEAVQDLPSRRKLNSRGTKVADPVFIEPEILKALLLYLQSNVDDVIVLVAKFLNMFIMESPFLEGFEIDNFILRNGKLLSLCTWAAYDIQQEGLALPRTNLLLRTLLIDPEPFYSILRSYIDPSVSSVERRMSGVNRLFRIISDVTSPAFGVEGRQWRSSVIEIFSSFFSALWKDPDEEIRIVVRTFSAALLPVHFEAISQCWNESLRKAPVGERARLVAFLIQLRPHFPSWRVLGWDAVIDTLIEYDYDPKTPTTAHFPSVDVNSVERARETYNLSSTDPDLADLRVSIILLSLQMIADGIEIDNFSIMKLKVQFVQIAGFSRVSVIPTQSGQSFLLQFDDITEISESSYPCVEELIRVIDAPYYSTLPYTALGIPDGPDDKTINVLVGSTFLDTSLCILGNLHNLESLPVLTLKCLLETLYIAIHKFDFQDRLFQHLQPLLRGAVLRAIELLSKDISYELRQLSLSIAQAAIKKWHMFLGATVSTILQLVATEIASQVRHSQDSLVVNGKVLIGTTLQSFCQYGLLLGLMRRPLHPEFFTVLDQVFNGQGKDTNSISQSICDPLLRDTLSRVSECDPSSFQVVLRNISTFIEVVYNKGYSSDLIIFVGQHLTHLGRRMSDGSIQGPDPSPLIVISVVLIQNNKKHVKELLPYVDTLIRVVLNRLQVKSACISRLIQATATYKPKETTQESALGSIDIVGVLFEILLDGLRMKTKIPSMSIKSLIDCLLSSEDPASLPPSRTHLHVFKNMADDANTFLQHYGWREESIEDDFKSVSAAGKLLLSIANHDPTILQRLTDQIPTSDKAPRLPFSIRSWNILLLVALQEEHKDWISMIYGQFPTFSGTYSAVLRSYVHSGISSSTSATTDINQAHISMKLWLMLSNSLSKVDQSGEHSIFVVWNELWPAYEGFLGVLENEARLGGQYSTLTSLTCTSIADLLLYTHSWKSPLALETPSHAVILNRVRILSQGDSSSSKISRAIRNMAEPPTEIVSSSVLLDQIGKELVAAEKIRIIEGKKDHGRIVGDRARKDHKLPTT